MNITNGSERYPKLGREEVKIGMWRFQFKVWDASGDYFGMQTGTGEAKLYSIPNASVHHSLS